MALRGGSISWRGRAVWGAFHRFFLLGLLMAAGAPSAVAMPDGEAHAGPAYRLAVYPYLTPLRLDPIFAPAARELASALGVGVRLVTRPSYRAFRSALAAERFEIVFLQPFDYVESAAPLGYIPLARSSAGLSAVTVVPQDAAVGGLHALHGATVAFPPREAAVTRLGLAALRARGMRPGRHFEPTFETTHFACMNRVLVGAAQACVTAPAMAALFEVRSGRPLRVILRSRPIPGRLFAAHRSVPASLRARLRTVITGWARTDGGRALLLRGRLAPFVPATDADYAVVRSLIGMPPEGG